MTYVSFGSVAPTSRRAVAYIIDALIAAALSTVLITALIMAVMMTDPRAALVTLLVGLPLVFLVLIGWFIVYTVMQSGTGSIGMRAQGLRLARAADGAPLGFGKTLLRNVIFGLAASIVVGYFTPLFDGSGRFQGWHDKVAGSLMLDARAGGTVDAAPPTEAMTVPPVPPLPTASAPLPQSAPPVPAPAAPAPAPAPAQPTYAAPAAAADNSLIAFVPGVTQDGPPAAAREVDAPTPVAVPDPTLTPADEGDIEDTRISVPGHRLVFTWDDGLRVPVSKRTLFGRNPAPEEGAVVVPVRDETLSLSKTHFEAASEPASGGWIIDRHSTNGTVVVRDGQRIECVPGERTHVRLGDAIEIGERIVTVGGYT